MNWILNLEFSDLWQSYKKGSLTKEALVKEVVNRLNKLDLKKVPDNIHPAAKNELNDVIIEFEELLEMDYFDMEDFDEVLDHLYDWADSKIGYQRLCWVNTFGGSHV